MAALLDTGFLLAVIDADDNLHAPCAAALEAEPNPLLPDVVLPELAYLIIRELGHQTLARFLHSRCKRSQDFFTLYGLLI
jgi:predicted nucleic acid-binding protein